MNGYEAIAAAESTWGISLKRVSSTEYRSLSGCPFCGDGGKGDKSDRFRVFVEPPRYWCRQCGQQGFLDKLDETKRPTPEELLARRVTELERKQREHEERLRRLEEMKRCTDHLRYHEALSNEAREYWFREGILEEAIEKYLLGFCTRCPTDREHRASYTIPVVNGGDLQNIRHRLRGAMGDKYRPHRAGLGTQLFNADLLATERGILVVEGAKKAIVLTEAGFPAVGIMGKRSFRREWLPLFDRVQRVFVALDPDAAESAYRLGSLFGNKAKVVTTPTKIDDMIVKYGASSGDVERCLRLARPVQ